MWLVMRTLNLWGMERGISWVSVVLVSFSFLVVSFGDSVLEGQDSRRLAPSSKIGCSYRDGRYEHGEPVQTPEPCLNCTCTRGVLVCYLRVCPTLVPPSSDCFAVKEADDCCATMICNSIHRPKINESIAIKTHFSGRTLTNNMPTYKKTEVIHIANNHRASTEPLDTTTRAESTVEPPRRNFTPSESLLFISSTPVPFEKDFDVLFNSITGCYVNGTIYAEGSAMISSSFCEYCYCIRGKQMCVRPKCHLSIEGCSPRYFSQYTCCPTRYMCNEKRKIYRLTSPSVTTSTTTTALPTMFIKSTMQPSGCIVEGIQYQVGDPIPSTVHCQTCYCSKKGIICTSVTCSPAMEGCEPVIPEGHCCPLEFKCNFTQTPPSDIQESTIEMNNENNSFVPDRTLEMTTTYPFPATNANKSRQEIKEILKTGQPVKPGSVADPSFLSPAIMRENDRVIYFPEFAGNLRRRISEVASVVGYSTKQSNKGPFHSFRPPVSYKRNNEKATYFSKQGMGLIPRHAAGRGRSDFESSDDIDRKEADAEIVATSDNLDITNMEYLWNITRESSTPNSFSIKDSTTIYEDSLIESTENFTFTEDFRQTSTNTDTFESEKILDETTRTTIAISTIIPIKDHTITATLDFSEDLTKIESSNLERSKSIVSTSFNTDNTTFFSSDDNITIFSISDDYYLNRSIIAPTINDDETMSSPTTVGNKQQREQITETTTMTNNHTDIIEDISTVTFFPQELSNDTEFSKSIEEFRTTDSPSSGEMHGSAMNSTLSELYSNLSSLFVDISSSTYSSLPVMNITRESILEKDNYTGIYPKLLDDYDTLVKPTLPEQRNLSNVTSSIEGGNFSVNESRAETSKGIWYSEPGLTTSTSSFDEETFSSSKLDDKKRPRQKDEESRFANNMHIIPFLAKDAITSRPYTWLTRNRTQQATTKQPVEAIVGHCIINGRVFINGEMIGHSDPCSLCRCFYGKALCQQQECPSPPSSDCLPEQLPDFCCPRYICGKSFTNAPTVPTISVPTVSMISASTGDQYSSQEFNWQGLSTETSQITLHAEKDLKPDINPLITSSTSRYIDSTYQVDENIQSNKNYPSTFDFNPASSTTNIPRTIVPFATTTIQSNTKVTHENLNQGLSSTTESSEHYPEGIKSEFWALLRVSGCNIYGQYYQVNERVTELSEECKECTCTKDGVKCSDIC